MLLRKRILGVLLASALLCGICAVPSLALEQAPSLGQASGDFDKDARADVTFAIDWGGGALAADGFASVTCGGQALAPGKDYTLSSDTLTIRKEFLFARPFGINALEFTFNDAASTRCGRNVRVFFDQQVWVTTLHPWLRFQPPGATEISNRAAYDDFVEFLSDTANWEYVAENIDVLEFLGVTTSDVIVSDQVVTQFCDMVKSLNARRAALGKKRLQISFQVGGIIAYTGLYPKGSYEEVQWWFEHGEGLVSAIPRMKAQGVYADYIHLDGTISRATGNQAAASGSVPSPNCPVMTQAQAIEETVHLMRCYREYYEDVGHEIKFIYLFNFPNHGWKGDKAVTFDGSGYSDAYSDMLALDSAARAAGEPLLGFTLDAPYDYMGCSGIDLMGRCLDFEAEARALNYTAGMIFNTEPDGVKGDTSAYFYSESLKYIEAYEAGGGRPDVYLSMSWYNTAPATHLPETDPSALTYQAKAYIEHVKSGVPVYRLGDAGWFYPVTRCNMFWPRLANILSLTFACREYQKVQINYVDRTGVTVEYCVGEKNLTPSAIAEGSWKPYTGPFFIHPGFFFGLICPKTVYVRISDGAGPPVYGAA